MSVPCLALLRFDWPRQHSTGIQRWRGGSGRRNIHQKNIGPACDVKANATLRQHKCPESHHTNINKRPHTLKDTTTTTQTPTHNLNRNPVCDHLHTH